jgi:hypothetical protein
MYGQKNLFPVIAAFLAILTCLLTTPLFAQVTVDIKGKVSDDNGFPVSGAKIELVISNANAGGQNHFLFESDANGAFEAHIPAGNYECKATAPGFSPQTAKLDLNAPKIVEIVLNAELHQKYEVTDTVPGIRTEEPEHKDTITGKLLDVLPLPKANNYRMEDALTAKQGVVRPPTGGIYFKGDKNINWRIDQLFNMGAMYGNRGEAFPNLGVTGFEEISLLSGRYLAEHGMAASSVLLQPKIGSDKFKFEIRQIVPGFGYVSSKNDRKGGVQFDNFSPKFYFSGPLGSKLRFSFDNNFDYGVNRFYDMPKGSERDTAPTLVGSNFLRLQWSPTLRHSVAFGGLYSYMESPYNGLGPLDPVSVTKNTAERGYMAYVKDQYVITPNTLFQGGFSRVDTRLRSLPRCVGLLEYRPEGRNGCSYENERLAGVRNEIVGKLTILRNVARGPLKGSHELKIGTDVSLLSYSERGTKTGFSNHRLDGSKTYQVTFGGTGTVRDTTQEYAIYLQDVWKPLNWLALGAGIRYDRNAFMSAGSFTPRLNISIVPPFFGGRTKIVGGFARTPEGASLYILTRPQAQYNISGSFNREGTQTSSYAQFYRVDRATLRMPIARVGSAGIEQLFPLGITAGFNFLVRSISNGFAFELLPSNEGFVPPDTLPAGMPFSVLRLENQRWTKYSEYEANVKKTFSLHGWSGVISASFARSSATSNAPWDYSAIPPQRYAGSSSVLLYDIPNRFVADGLIETPLWGDIALSYLLDMRSGLPYSISNDEGWILGNFNDHRMPSFISLNLLASKTILHFGSGKKSRVQLRLGAENVLGRPNYCLVNTNTASPAFGQLFGELPRKFIGGIKIIF